MSETRGRRDRHDIVAEILLNARGGAIKTHIMYKAKLSYGQLSEYLPMLVEKGFLENTTVVEHRQTKRVFKTTEEGERFLDKVKSIDSLWSAGLIPKTKWHDRL
jgi:predicted transcriptional regulator